jgi:hypothetical protein
MFIVHLLNIGIPWKASVRRVLTYDERAKFNHPKPPLTEGVDTSQMVEDEASLNKHLGPVFL